MRGKFFGLVLVVIVAVFAYALFHSDEGGKKGGTDHRPVSGTPGDDGETPDPPEGPDTPITPVGDVEREVVNLDPITPSAVDHSGVLLITGRVVVAGTGAPIEGADIELKYPNGDDIEDATSADDGSYSIEVVDGIPSVIAFRVSAQGFASHPPTMRSLDGNERTLQVDFEMTKSFRIEGRVTSAFDGKGVPDADVELRCLNPIFEDSWEDAETDENGNYAILDITDLPTDGIDVWVESPEFAPMVKRNLRLEPGGSVLRVDFILWEALTITGSVYSRVTGQPLEDAEVSVSSRDPEFMDDGEDELTDEDGSFALNVDTLPYDQLFIVVTYDDHAPKVISPIPAPDRRGIIELGQIALESSVTLRGVIRDATNGTPVTGGDIYVYSGLAPDAADGDYADSETIGIRGEFEIELQYAPAQGAEMLIEADGYEPLRHKLDLAPSVTLHDMVFQVEPVIRLTGVVRRAADNRPIPGAAIRVLTGTASIDADAPYARARADGKFALSLPRGDVANYSVVIDAGMKRFPMGPIGPPPAGQSSIVKEYKVDVPVR